MRAMNPIAVDFLCRRSYCREHTCAARQARTMALITEGASSHGVANRDSERIAEVQGTSARHV
jgi:hypothetical protein